MANQMTVLQSTFSIFLKLKVVRELILLVPTLNGRRTSNKTEDYGVFKPSRLSHIERITIYVTDLQRSIEWYRRVVGATCARIDGPLPHPTNPDQTVHIAVLNLMEQQGSILLVQRTDAHGATIPVSNNGCFHYALEMPQGRTAFEMTARLRATKARIAYGPVKHIDGPGGDGEPGGNIAVYTYDPDWHNVEFFYEMDSVKSNQRTT